LLYPINAGGTYIIVRKFLQFAFACHSITFHPLIQYSVMQKFLSARADGSLLGLGRMVMALLMDYYTLSICFKDALPIPTNVMLYNLGNCNALTHEHLHASCQPWPAGLGRYKFPDDKTLEDPQSADLKEPTRPRGT
jgi:hypothetical protein